MAGPTVVVFGQIARDLVLSVDEVPPPGGSVPVHDRRELLGGKGANQAVGLTQLGRTVALVGVVGDDRAGEDVLVQARRDGIDVSCVLQRPGARTSLLVDVVTGDGERRLLEDTPPQVLLTAEDVAAAAHLVRTADTVVVQAQQTGEAVLAALRLAHEHGARTVLDGAPDARVVPQALSLTDVLRADEQEAGLLCDRDLTGPGEFISAARQLLAAGPSLVVLAAGRAGNVVAWTGGERLVPLTDATVVDRTGAGDVAVAAVVVALQDGRAPADAAEYAAAAQADTVQRLGGRPPPCADTTGVSASLWNQDDLWMRRSACRGPEPWVGARLSPDSCPRPADSDARPVVEQSAGSGSATVSMRPILSTAVEIRRRQVTAKRAGRPTDDMAPARLGRRR